MARSRAHGVPLFAVATIVITTIVSACGGGAGPIVGATTAPAGSAPAGSAPAESASSSSATTPNAALLADLIAAGVAPDDALFLASTTVDVTSSAPGKATIVEHLLSGDTTEITVTVSPATGTPGLVSSSSSTTDDRIEVHLEYLVSTEGMSEEVRQSLEGVAAASRQVASLNAGPLLAAEVTVLGVTVDWATSKAKSTVRDTAIKNIVEGALPGKSGTIMRLVKAGFTVERAAEIGTKLDAQLAELDRLAECARNPTNPLTIKQYQEDPGARDRVIKQIAEARNELIANTIVVELGVINGFVAGFGPKWLGYAIGPGTAWSRSTLEALNQERLEEIRKAITKCDCILITDSRVEPMVWHGERPNSLDPEWLIQGESNTAGYAEKWLYRAVIDARTKRGPYKYEAIGSIAGGTLTKNGAGDASVVMQPDGSAILTIGATKVRGTITAGGTTQTVDLDLPETAFTWLAQGTDCGSTK